MYALALAFAFAASILALSASALVIAHGVKIKGLVPTAGGFALFACAIAVLGAISA